MTTAKPDQVVREAYDAFNDRDKEGLLSKLADDITWESPGTGPTAGTYNGPSEVWDGIFAPIWDAPMRIEATDAVSTDVHGAVNVDLVFTLGEDERRWKLIEVVRVEDGRIVERRSYIDRQEEFDRFLEQAARQMAGQAS